MTRDDMDPYFRDIFTGLAQASDGLRALIAGLERTVVGASHAHGEHEELRESVARLEALVVEQGGEVRELRAEIRQLRERLNGGAA